MLRVLSKVSLSGSKGRKKDRTLVDHRSRFELPLPRDEIKPSSGEGVSVR